MVDHLGHMLPVAVHADDRFPIRLDGTRQRFDASAQRAVEQVVVRVEKAQVLPCCVRYSDIASTPESTVLGSFDHRDTCVTVCVGERKAQRRIARAILDHDHLDVGVVLFETALDCSPQKVWLAKARDDDADPRHTITNRG